MKTVALKEKTFGLLRELKEKLKAESFDKLVLELIIKKEKVPDSMLGVWKGKGIKFTPAERRRIWKDKYRE